MSFHFVPDGGICQSDAEHGESGGGTFVGLSAEEQQTGLAGKEKEDAERPARRAGLMLNGKDYGSTPKAR